MPKPIGAIGANVIVGAICAEVTSWEASEGAEVPIALLAVTVKVYDTPGIRPVTTRGDPVPLAVSSPGLEVTV